MSPSVEVRRAMEDDLPALRRLLHRYFAEGDVHCRDSAATLLEQMQARRLGWYVAARESVLVGCVRAHLLAEIAGAAECKRLYVAPEERGRGVAGALMERVEDAARSEGLTWMYLDTKDSFAAAKALYARRGYTACARFNRNPEAAFFFRKPLG